MSERQLEIFAYRLGQQIDGHYTLVFRIYEILFLESWVNLKFVELLPEPLSWRGADFALGQLVDEDCKDEEWRLQVLQDQAEVRKLESSLKEYVPKDRLDQEGGLKQLTAKWLT